ncbi:tyrosine-type recombinase/integrase, partial [Pseudonocardia sp. RS010]|uniref:tyrosine-type recombinase/integrase n=1 Tax=Pseudonocardia sp. RS010 TaxID=3385979 RepID=UPI0039A233A6
MTEEDMLAWRQGLRGRPETIASCTSAAHGIFRGMTVRARPRLRDDDPTLILDRPKIPEALPRPMVDRHFDLALACATADPELYAWLALMGCCGLRCCEVAWLQVGDVEIRDDGSGLLHIEGKGGKRRIVPMGTTLVPVIEPFMRGRGPLFTRAT